MEIFVEPLRLLVAEIDWLDEVSLFKRFEIDADEIEDVEVDIDAEVGDDELTINDAVDFINFPCEKFGTTGDEFDDSDVEPMKLFAFIGLDGKHSYLV